MLGVAAHRLVDQLGDDVALVPGGEKRTPSEYAQLLEPNGFRVGRAVPTASAVRAVDATRAR